MQSNYDSFESFEKKFVEQGANRAFQLVITEGVVSSAFKV